MKKIIAPTFCTLLLCSLMLITLGPTIATAQTYERFSRPTQVIPTLDGMWTTDDEWTDGQGTWIGTDVAFTSTWDNPGDDVYTRWIVEFLSDTTEDSGDYLRFYIDADASGGVEPDGVAYNEYMGYTDETNWYGTGGNWVEMQVDQSQVPWAASFSASPTSSTPHWIFEFQIGKNTGDLQLAIVWNFLLLVYDESNPGILTWPPDANPDNPGDYGIENYSSESPTEPIPEGLTFAVMALLTTVSMLVGYKYFIKRKETK